MAHRPHTALSGIDPYGEDQPAWSKAAPRPVSWRVQVAVLVLFWGCVAALLAGRALYLDRDHGAPGAAHAQAADLRPAGTTSGAL